MHLHVRGRLPRKQGLKHHIEEQYTEIMSVRGRLPRKQGLKLAHGMGSRQLVLMSEGDFHENKD